MKLKNILKEALFPIAIFFFIILFLAIIFSVNGFALFSHDDLTIISIDMQSQYIAYLRYYKSLLSGDGIIDVYTYTKTFGGDFLSIYTYYLSSPFNYLVALYSYADLPLFFLWSNILKMAFGGLFMYLLLRYTFKKVDIASIGFAFSYAFVSYGFIYSSNFMWLDGVMILPLIILGLKMIDDQKNPLVYIVALTYGLFSGWYIGAMIAVFTGLFFIALLISHENKKRKWFAVKFAGYSLIAGIASSANWLVALSHFGGTKATNNLPKWNSFSFSMFFSGMLENGYNSHNNITINTGYMPLFISIAVIALAIMFYFNRGYSLKRRLSYFGIILVYFFASLYTVTNALMHGGREPTWFPTRYAFVISFYFCYLGALQYHKKDQTPIWGILAPIVMMAIVLPIVLNVPNTFIAKNISDPVKRKEMQLYKLSTISLLIYLSVVLLMLLDYLLRKRKVTFKFQNSVLAIGISLLSVISAYRGANQVIKVNKENSSYYQKYETYLKDDAYTQYLKEDPTSPYRSTTLFNRPGNYNGIDNNPMFYSLSGLSHYSSTGKKYVEDYFSKLGFHRNGYFIKYCFGSTASINSLLSVKDIYDDLTTSQTGKPYFVNSSIFDKQELNEDGTIVKYENKAALPIGFTMTRTNQEKVKDRIKVEGKTSDYVYDNFEYQNEIFKSLSGLDKDIFTKLDIEYISLPVGVTVEYDEHGRTRYTTNSAGQQINIYFSYSGVIDENHNFYFGEKNENEARYLFDSTYIYNTDYWRKGIRGINVTNNNKHRLTIIFNKQLDRTEVIPELYVEDINVLKEHLDLIEAKQMSLTKFHTFSKAGLKGTTHIDNTRDLLFTMPYEKQIKVYIDGKKMPTMTRCDIFTGVDTSSLTSGLHEIEIYYQDNIYLVTSVIGPITLVTTIGLYAGYWLYRYMFIKKEENI